MIGKFPVRIKDYGTTTTQAGKPQLFIEFDVTADGATKSLKWFGSFVGKGKDITLKTLIYCGLQQQNYNLLGNFVNGVASGLLNMSEDLVIDVQEEPKMNSTTGMPDGTRTVIQWINNDKFGPSVKKIDESLNAQFFGTSGFENDLAKLAGEMGLNVQQQAQPPTGQPPAFNPNEQMPSFQQPPANMAPQGQPAQQYQQPAQQQPAQQPAQQYQQPAQQQPVNMAPQGQAPAAGTGYNAPF